MIAAPPHLVSIPNPVPRLCNSRQALMGNFSRVPKHLRRRSQRPFRPPEGVTYYEQLQGFGLVRL